MFAFNLLPPSRDPELLSRIRAPSKCLRIPTWTIRVSSLPVVLVCFSAYTCNLHVYFWVWHFIFYCILWIVILSVLLSYYLLFYLAILATTPINACLLIKSVLQTFVFGPGSKQRRTVFVPAWARAVTPWHTQQCLVVVEPLQSWDVTVIGHLL